ncbi:MAG TPA: alanine--tRNA ligase, partial [Candidatus Woesearchaeota archaeon]|nr:alanine--tRNA ligase [Candidatus Woesearchaeota archaeon]
CKKCKRHFWSQKEDDTCGDTQCVGKLTFIGKSPTKKKIEYIDVWKEYAKTHEKLGYTPIKRYPVIARWNPTTEFTIASIAAFQPYVVSGEIKPPANPLVIPQFCLRFNDTDNVGITGHNVGFIMLGEHAFVPPKEYDINKYIKDHLTWLEKGMGISLKKIKIHEDFWTGGGNFGPCMEFFSEGLEISNQVYMQYEVTTDGYKELKVKVLDMGQGYERIAWFTQGALNNYETMSPPVLKKMRERTGVELDEEFGKKFYPLSPRLNLDEIEDIEKAWEEIAKEIGVPPEELKEKVKKQAALYSVMEHSRALLVAITDGGLPSNVGGMYNLRVILRRALSYIDKYKWQLDIGEICEWHAEYLKPLFPELQKNIENTKKILAVEKKKYEATKEKIKQVLGRIITEEINTEKLIELYDSQGITPELVAEEAEKQGKKIEIPKDFYSLVSEKHEKKIQEAQTRREEQLELKSIKDTEKLYFEDYTKTTFLAEVLAIIGNKVILDKTMFYPTSGGQLHDTGELNGEKVIDVFKQGNIIVHVMKEKPRFEAGD